MNILRPLARGGHSMGSQYPGNDADERSPLLPERMRKRSGREYIQSGIHAKSTAAINSGACTRHRTMADSRGRIRAIAQMSVVYRGLYHISNRNRYFRDDSFMRANADAGG